MMWDKSPRHASSKSNDEINKYYNNLCQNQKLFGKFVNYIKNLQNNYDGKQSFVDSFSGMEKNYFVFNNEIERLNSHVASAADILRRFSQTRGPNQANCGWEELSIQISTLIELLNNFLNNTSNITNNFGTSSKFNQGICASEPRKISNFTQTIESDICDENAVREPNCADIPVVIGPIRRKRIRHSTKCCSCGKSKVSNKSTQTKINDSKKQDKSCCCLCATKSQESYKFKKDGGSWVTLYEVQTQTGKDTGSQGSQYSKKDVSFNNRYVVDDSLKEAPCSRIDPRVSNHTSRSIAEQFIRLTESSYLPSGSPVSASISPTPYGVSSNSLPGDKRTSCTQKSTPMEDNITLLLKLLEEIEKSLQVVKQLHETLLEKTRAEPTKSLISKSPNPDNDINLRLCITLENNLPENVILDQIPDQRISITPGKRLSSFFKRKNENLSFLDNKDDNNSVKSDSINNENLQGDFGHDQSEPFGATSSPRRPSFRQSLYEDDPDFAKCLLKKPINKSDCGDTHRKMTFQKSLQENNRDVQNSQRNTDIQFCKPNDSNSTRKSLLNNPDMERRSTNQGPENGRSNKTTALNTKRTSCDHNFSSERFETESVLHESDDIPVKSEQNNREFKHCPCCDKNHSHQNKPVTHCPCCGKNHDSSENFQNVEPFRCPACQHRCVYCKSCFEMNESLINCLKKTKDGKCDKLIGPSNSNTNPPKDDKNFWAEAMMYLTPNFLSALRRDTKSGNVNSMPDQNLMKTTEQKSTQINHVHSEASSPECSRKTKYKWVLIRVEYFEDGSRQINLINDADIPENSYLTASK